MASVIDLRALATGALAFSIALAWNDAVNTSIKALYPNNGGSSVRIKLAYAIVVTILVIVAVTVINLSLIHAAKLRGPIRDRVIKIVYPNAVSQSFSERTS